MLATFGMSNPGSKLLWRIASFVLLSNVVFGCVTGCGFYGSALNIMCAEDTCVPQDVKELTRNCWPAAGQEIWRQCIGNNTCSFQAIPRVHYCIYCRIYMSRNMTYYEKRNLEVQMFDLRSLSECAGGQITLRMMACSAPIRNVQGNMPAPGQRLRRHLQSYPCM